MSISQGGLSASVQGPSQIALGLGAGDQAPGYPGYTKTDSASYLLQNNGELEVGVIVVGVVYAPWVLPGHPTDVSIDPGESVQLSVQASGEGFVGNSATLGASYQVVNGPAARTAVVNAEGIITYTAPANAVPGTSETFKIRATDSFGQHRDTFANYTARIKGTAEADAFSAEIPYEGAPNGTRVDILPNHARGVNPVVTSVTANVNNAAVGFDTTGAVFTPPAGRAWGPTDNGYSFAAPYTVNDANGVAASAQINVRVLRPPLLSVDAQRYYAPLGGSASATVRVMNHPVIPATGGYRISQQPAVGTAMVDDTGVVTYTHATSAVPGDVETVTVEVTDRVTRRCRQISRPGTSRSSRPGSGLRARLRLRLFLSMRLVM